MFLILFIVFKITGYELSLSIDIRILVISALIGLDLVICIISLWIGFIVLRSVQSSKQKAIYSRFLGLLALSFLIRYFLGPVMFMHPLLMAGFLLLFFLSFIIPLFYLTKNADDLFPREALDLKETVNMDLFFSKHQISKREAEIIGEICKGKSNKQIADTLFISLQTVKDHTHRIYTKVGINSRMQLLQKVNTGR